MCSVVCESMSSFDINFFFRALGVSLHGWACNIPVEYVKMATVENFQGG